MGLNILQGNYQITDMRSMFRPLIHVWGEDSLTPLPYNINRYIFDIYIDGNFVLRELKAPIIASSQNIYQYIDMSRVLSNYISSDLKKKYNIPYKEYVIQYGYEDLSGTLYTNVVSETSYAWYGYPSFNQEDMLNDIGSIIANYGGLYLTTNKSRVLKMYAGYNVYIPLYRPSIYNNSTFNFDYLGTGYNINDSLIGYGVYHHKVNYSDLTWTTPANQQYYEYNCDGDPITNTIDNRIYFGENCTKGNPVMVTFLNSLGGYESFLFSLVNRSSTSIERNAYTKDGLITHLDYSASPPPFGSSISELYRYYNDFGGEMKINYNNTMTHKMKLISDYINQVDFKWLRELLASPSVYVQIDGSTTMIPATITTSDWTEKFSGIDKVFNMEIDIELGTQQTQLR